MSLIRFCFLSIACRIVPTSASESCLDAPDTGSVQSVDAMLAMTEKETDLAQEDEVEWMQVQLLQTLHLQRRSSRVEHSEKEVTGRGYPLLATESTQGSNVSSLDEMPSNKHQILLSARTVSEGNRSSPASPLLDFSAKREPIQSSRGLLEQVEDRAWLATLLAKRPPLLLLIAFVTVVFVVAAAVQFLMCSSMLKLLPKPFVSTRGVCKSSTIRSFVQQLGVSSALDIEVDRQPTTNNNNQILSRPLSSGRLVRFEAKVEGTFDRSTISTPLTRRSCVMYSASAKCQGESIAAARDAKQSDFIVSLVDAPWVKVLVASGDVVCFDMHSGIWSLSERLVDAPEILKAFVVENINPDCLAESPSSERDAKKLNFEESSLLVGSIITLVGKLCQSPGGQLVLQTWHESGENIRKHGSIWYGKVLASDDSSLHRKATVGGRRRPT